MSIFGTWVPWLVLIGVFAGGAVLVYVAWWALFADRPRGRRRCPKCWYDMAYAPGPGMTCAECGFIARRESQFHRARRRYGIAAIAILSAVALTAFINDRANQRGLASVLPTRMLIWLLPLAGPSNGGIYGEVMGRAGSSLLTAGEWEALLARCACGDWRAGPPGDDWIQKYGAMISNWRQRFVGDSV